MQVDYNKIWQKQWGGAQDFGPTHAHSRRNIFKLINGLNFESLLDIGCGNGKNIAFLAAVYPHIKKIAGIDISAEALQIARKRLPEAKFYNMDVQNDSLNETFDLVFSSDVLEHLPDDRAALQNIYKMTGKYFLAVTLQGRMRGFEREIGHVRNYKKGELEEKIKSVGFVVVKKIEWGFPFFSPLYRNFLDFGSMNQQTGGRVGIMKNIFGYFLYLIFFLNSRRNGDIIFILASR